LSENLHDPTNNVDHDINQCMSDFIQIFQSRPILNKHAPVRTQIRKKKKIKKKTLVNKRLIAIYKAKTKCMHNA